MSIITISRGTFSGGKELAERLAAELGYPCLSREVFAEAAEEYGVSQAALQAAITQAPTIMDRLRRDRNRYLAFIRAVLCQHASKGQLIYHGNAGHHLLAGVRHVLRVRVVADTTYRIKAAMQQLNMTSRQAEHYISKVDGERRKWTQFLYGVEWDDASNYDVVLNLEYMGIPGAVSTVVRMVQLEAFQPTEESKTTMENLTLASLVNARLAQDKRTNDADFIVRARNGVVTIEGVVRLAETADAALDVARGVPGVKDVVGQVAPTGYPV
ncbi:MAG: cytidylate kinase family protein [Pseudomonadota bacterium]